MKLFGLLVLFCSGLAFGQQAQGSGQDKIDPALRTEIQALLKTMRLDFLMRQQLKSSMPPLIALLKQNPAVSTQFADEFGKRFETEVMSSNELIDMIIEAYARRFSLAEIKDLEVFYKSPTGKKMVEVQPELMSEVSKKGGAYGQDLAIRLGREIAEQHPEYLIKKEASPAGAPPPSADNRK